MIRRWCANCKRVMPFVKGKRQPYHYCMECGRTERRYDTRKRPWAGV